ncbi:DMT family transporter [Pararhizobium sp. O133]|uniref:DMT family transporter n=1 Tax=Pararhizobium sp. O133 TaxID=3449278 RepID=UPI003F68476B
MTTPQGAAGPGDSSRAFLGIVLMCIAMFVVPIVDVFAKMLVQQGIPPLQTVFLRMAMGTLLLVPVVRIYSPQSLGRIRQPLPVFMLGLSIVGSTTCFFIALEFMPIANALAISFVQPFFVTILSKYVLKEQVGASRWSALVIGFAATLMIIRPNSDAFEPNSIFALMAGAFMALYVITVRSGVKITSALTTTFYTHASATALAAPFMFFLWETMNLEKWLLIMAMALVGLLVQFLMIKAYEFGEASLIAPLSYMEMISSTLAGLWFFSEFPDRTTFLGVAILICCAVFTSYHTKSRSNVPLNQEN